MAKRTAPASIRKSVSSEDFPGPADVASIIDTGGEINMDDLRQPSISGPTHDDYLKELQFQNELIEIVLAESSDPNAENPVPFGVNGRMVWIPRGVPKVVPRHFAEVIARAKLTNVKTPEIVAPDGAGGMERKTVIRKSTSQMYPFEVTRDPSPRGREWLRALRASA